MLDLVVHRILELTKEISNAAKSLEKLLEHIGGLYKFHGMRCCSQSAMYKVCFSVPPRYMNTPYTHTDVHIPVVTIGNL